MEISDKTVYKFELITFAIKDGCPLFMELAVFPHLIRVPGCGANIIIENPDFLALLRLEPFSDRFRTSHGVGWFQILTGDRTKRS